ncbi:DUF3455 domain-containing protein [Lentzea sp. NPDC004782]|uniref:DUF3455 domain-containing protein n=1 Tax=Lentzea sp. NPDC004782 TaxID=3154458 RepID=UPI0033B9D41C
MNITRRAFGFKRPDALITLAVFALDGHRLADLAVGTRRTEGEDVRTKQIAAVLRFAAMTTIGLLAAAVPAAADQVPDQIKVPAGNKRIEVLSAHGVQTYQCANGGWSFLEPDAILQRHGQAVVLHTKGPVWTSVEDGSSVTGAAVASSPVSGAIPQLLLRSTGNRGSGLLGNVTFVQRLDTTGGLPSSGQCQDGAITSIPYTSRYAFWVADHS